MKFCKDCVWIRHSKFGGEPACASSDYDKPRNMVDGRYIMSHCIDLRNDPNKCGTEANWFQEPLSDE